MKILFICGSIESGYDGVGDYTKLICSSLVKRGYNANILALYDKRISGLVKETIISGNSSFNITRISHHTFQHQRFIWTQNCINLFNPDCISLQFVPYSYNSKGLPFWLPNFLNQIKGNHIWNIMFHELWIGRSKNVGFKNIAISYLQQFIIKQLIVKIKPQIIHTHLPVYMGNLKKMANNILPLPLFSNINPPINFCQTITNNSFKWAFFSQVDTLPDIINFINTLNIGLKENGFIPELIIIGGNKEKMLPYIEDFKSKCPLLRDVICTGFLNENEISLELRKCSLGITPVPQHGIGKSGSVAAFLSHGIPVAAPVFIKEFSEDGIGFFDNKWRDLIIIDPDFNEIKKAKKSAQIYKDMFTVEKICTKLINDLK